MRAAASRKSVAVRRAIACFASVIVAFALAEIALRVTGIAPARYLTIDLSEPTMHEPHKVLGWKGIEGSYVLPPYAAGGSEFKFSLLARGDRRTRKDGAATGQEVVFVGGSFTQGWAIGDEETFAWKLQERFPNYDVLNFGTGGYGTYQSLLVLERELPGMKSPRLVVYSFIFHHETRNVAEASWLRALSLFSKRGMPRVPFVTVADDGRLVRHPPQGYPRLPFRLRSATISLMGDAYTWLRAGGRASQKTQATRLLMREMANTAREYDAELLVVLLSAPPKMAAAYIDYLNGESIAVADCSRVPMTTVAGEGHPDGATNTRWADCISDALEEQELLFR